MLKLRFDPTAKNCRCWQVINVHTGKILFQGLNTEAVDFKWGLLESLV